MWRNRREQGEVTNSDGRKLGPVRRWLLTYLHCVDLLHAYGERAWPWNVQFVWTYVRREIGLDGEEES